MKTIIAMLLKLAGEGLTKLLSQLCQVASSFFQFKRAQSQNELDKRRKADDETFCREVDKVADSGSIDDLLNLRRRR